MVKGKDSKNKVALTAKKRDLSRYSAEDPCLVNWTRVF